MEVISEARVIKGNKEVVPVEDKVAVGGKIVDDDKYTYDKLNRKSATKNPSKGIFGVNEPTDDSVVDDEEFSQDTIDENNEALLDKFLAEEDFFILGRAGWGKTSMITSMAKRFGYDVITFYLDKCQATDLGGIPVAMKMKEKSGEDGVKEKRALPPFAQIIRDNPDKKFLLFFDEMNQAAPDVMHALMPIILKKEICNQIFDNFFVGAAGNFESENAYVTELSGPLKSRFAPIIIWNTGDDESWATACKFLHKKWDKTVGKEIVDEICDHCKLFENPRELDMKIIKWAYRMRMNNNPDKSAIRPSRVLKRLTILAKDELTRTQNDELSKLADKIYAFINKKDGDNKRTGRSTEKNVEMMKPEIAEKLKEFIENGVTYFKLNPNDKEGSPFGVCKENFKKFIDYDVINAEMLERFLKQMDVMGVKFKYNTKADWIADGHKNYLDIDDFNK